MRAEISCPIWVEARRGRIWWQEVRKISAKERGPEIGIWIG
jgi:hypothetical protein